MLYQSKSMRVPSLSLLNNPSLKIKAIMEADPDRAVFKIPGVEWVMEEVEEGVASQMDGEVEDGVAFLMVVEVTVSFMTKVAKEVKVVKEASTRVTKTTMVVAEVAEVQEEDTIVVIMAIQMAQLRQHHPNLQQLSQQGQHKWISLKSLRRSFIQFWILWLRVSRSCGCVCFARMVV
jgi:hypothetical protein